MAATGRKTDTGPKLSRPVRKLTTLLGATALLVGFGATVGAPTASAAAPCDYVAYTNNSSAVEKFKGTYNLKTRPAAECNDVISVSQGTTFYAWCYHWNYYGNLWVYGRIAGTEIRGWTSVANLEYQGGSVGYC